MAAFLCLTSSFSSKIAQLELLQSPLEFELSGDTVVKDLVFSVRNRYGVVLHVVKNCDLNQMFLN